MQRLLMVALIAAACTRPPPTCTDQTRNGQESDVDCGGPDCQRCELTKTCATHEDCTSGLCRQRTCAPRLEVECRRNTDCPSGSCLDGVCGPACAPPLSPCGQTCVDPRNDPAHCGMCSRACTANERCENGMCTVRCPPATMLCPADGGTLCVDPMRDALHCGNCTTACPAGQACRLGMCEPDCAPFQAFCAGQCVNTSTDPRHCGGCDRGCDGGLCSMGMCRAACVAPTTACDGGAQCVDVRFDPMNCGACGVPCPPVPHALPLCLEQQCTRTECDPGFDDCNGFPGDGCEADLANDPMNCGVCRRACSCVNGMCP